MNHILVPCQQCNARNKIPADRQHQKARCGRCSTSINIGPHAVPIELDDSSFQKVIEESSLPVLVDFYSPSCGHCQMLAPTIDSLARQYYGRLLVAKLNASRHSLTAGRYQIRGVPALFFFRNGEIVDQMVGAPPPEALHQKISQLAGS